MDHPAGSGRRGLRLALEHRPGPAGGTARQGEAGGPLGAADAEGARRAGARRCRHGSLLRGDGALDLRAGGVQLRKSEEHTSELQSLMRISYAVFCLTKKKNTV